MNTKTNSMILQAFRDLRVLLLLVAGLGALAAEESNPDLHPDGSPWGVKYSKNANPELPRILLIGDSIVNGYNSTVKKHLAERAVIDVWVTGRHLASPDLHGVLARVVAAKRYDLIHFNIGLHGWSKGRIPKGRYEPLLRQYVGLLRQHAPQARLIWASTTQITVKGKPTELDPEHNPTIAGRNTIAARVMADCGIPITDLYGLMSDKLKLARGDKYHWSGKGVGIQGKAVADAIGRVLNQPGPPNVLMICFDDLRCELGAYGEKNIHTPNIDRLAREGRLFSRHYVHEAACGPSRSAMLTGIRTGQWNVWKKIKKEPKRPVSLPHLFKQNGYQTVCIGKVSHAPGGLLGNPKSPRHEVPFSWDRTYAPVGQWKTPWRAFFAYENGEAYNVKYAPGKPRLPYEKPKTADTLYPDTLNATAAIKELATLSKDEKPFFLAVGFYKPHLPFCAPGKWWDYYRTRNLPRPSINPNPPKNTDPSICLHDSYEPRTHYHWPEGDTISAESGAKLKRGYYAAVSYVDEQAGRVLDAAKEMGLMENTIIILWSDHGWHLGDHGIWGKATQFETSLRSPLIVKIPSMRLPGQATQGMVEAVDIYPTLADLCGLMPPKNLEGRSFAPQLVDPAAPGKEAAVGMRGNGRTIRTDDYRYVEWRGKSGEIILRELYDMGKDPLQTINIATSHPEKVEELSAKLETLYDFKKIR